MRPCRETILVELLSRSETNIILGQHGKQCGADSAHDVFLTTRTRAATQTQQMQTYESCTLELRCVHDRYAEWVQLDVPVHGAVKNFGSSSSFVMQCCKQALFLPFDAGFALYLPRNARGGITHSRAIV